MSVRYPGCHGFAVEPREIGVRLGWVEQPPPRRVAVDVVAHVERRPGGRRLWWTERRFGEDRAAFRAELWCEPGGRLWFGNRFVDGEARNGDGAYLTMTIERDGGAVRVAPPPASPSAVLEALANVALPVLAQAQGALVVHGAACSLGGDATLVTAPAGRGKSSIFAALVAAGWEALAEDQCVIDVEGDTVRVWPGANWVRLRDGVVMPPIDTIRFRAPGKIVWDVDPWSRRAHARLSRIVFLESPGEELWEPVDPGVTVGLLARLTPWHQEEMLGERAFGPLVDLAMTVPAYRLRLPESPRWLEDAVALLSGAPRP